jgi:hypothetical protein
MDCRETHLTPGLGSQIQNHPSSEDTVHRHMVAVYKEAVRTGQEKAFIQRWGDLRIESEANVALRVAVMVSKNY